WPGCWCFGLLQKKCCTRTAASDALRNLSKREVDLLGISGKIVEEDGGIVRVLIRIKDTARLRFGRVSLHITTGDGTTSSVWTGEQTGPLNVEFTISRKMIGDCSVFLGISDKGVPVLQEEGSPTYLLDLTSELIFGNLNPLSPQKEDNRRNTSSQPMKSKKSSR
ncbi:MAG: hypothetical protein WCP45_03980, partial [Verrucomicrobiota bacterium]